MAYEVAKEEAEDRAEKAEQKVTITFGRNHILKMEKKKQVIFFYFTFIKGDEADAKEANSAGRSVRKAGNQQEDDKVLLFLQLVLRV